MTDDQDRDEHVISEIVYRDVSIAVIEAPVAQVQIIRMPDGGQSQVTGYTIVVPTHTVQRLLKAHVLAAFIGGIGIAVQLLINHDLDE